MTTSSFDDRLNRIQWDPSPVPSQVIVDGIMESHKRGVAATELSLLGVLLGCVIGLLFKGSWLVEDALFSQDLGVVLGAFSLCAIVASVGGVVANIWRTRTLPAMTAFSTLNVLTIVIVLCS